MTRTVSASEQSDSGLDDSLLETNKDKEENKEETAQELNTPDINNTNQVPFNEHCYYYYYYYLYYYCLVMLITVERL